MATTSSPRARRVTRKEAKAATRRRVLDAARIVFLRDGFYAASVDAVAEEAGFTKGAVYANFESKADLFLELYRERMQERSKELERTVANSPDRPVQWWAAALKRDRAWLLALIEFWTLAARDPMLRRRFAAVQGESRRVMADFAARIARAKGRVDPFDADLAARAHVALGNGFLLESFIKPELLRSDAYERVATALEHGLLAMDFGA